MADTKITGLTALGAKPADTDVLVVVDDPGGTPVTKKVTYANLVSGLLNYAVCQGRPTLSSGVPVTTSDVTAATNVYYTPFRGNRVGLYDGSNWAVLAFSEITIAVPATTDTNYDVFLYNNGGTVTAETVAWTNATTRATAHVLQDGILSKSGDTTRRYVFTFRTTGVSGQCEDSEAKRFVWSYYNRLERRLYVNDGTNFTYAVAAWQDYNNDSTNKREYVCGVVEDWWLEELKIQLTNGACSVGPAADGGDPAVTGIYYFRENLGTYIANGQSLHILPSLGYHYRIIRQFANASTTYDDMWHAIAVKG
jgi:hypothetical protein